MTYAAESRRSGRRPITLAELDFERCSLTYGTAPCTAQLTLIPITDETGDPLLDETGAIIYQETEGTGSTKCYNTRGTCQDVPNFTPETVTYTFCEPRSDLPVGLNAIPALRGVTTAPTKLDIGQGLGQRSSASISLQDFSHHDRGMDDYIADRATPAGGTFWGRFRARNPYYFGRVCRIKTGYLTANGVEVENLVTRTYVIEQFAGPDIGGKVQITAKGLLKLADNERAQAPAPSTGVLSADITAVATSATLSPAGVGDDEYPASGYVRIGREVASFTRAGDVLTLVRAQWNTTASEHNSNDTVQLCLFYNSQQLDVICADLLVTYAGVPAAYVPTLDWAAEVAAYLPRSYTARITEPIGVRQLLTELVQQAPFYLFDDERAAEIKLRAIRGPDAGAVTLDDSSHFIAGSLSIADQPDLWLSQVWVYIGQIDPTETLDKTGNYRQLVITADPDSEGANTNNRKSIRKLFSRWLTSKAAADDLGAQLIDRFGETPRLVSFTLDAKDYALWTGDVCQVQTRIAQDVTGAPATLTTQVIEARESQVAHQFKYTALAFRYSTPAGIDRVITISANTVDFNLYDAYVALYGVPTTAVTLGCVIELGVRVGMSAAAAAFVVDRFPSGSMLSLENNGRIQGRGGNSSLLSDSFAGGTALLTSVPLTVDNPGELFGGGGGGGTQIFFIMGEPNYYGGGGGAGDLPGIAETAPEDPLTFPGADGTTEAGGAAGTDAGNGGGDGGGPGLPGQDAPGVGQFNGGAAGNAVEGGAFITWVSTGDRRGGIV